MSAYQRTFLLAWVAAIVSVASTTMLSAADRPNVVWIIGDDLGPELGCYGYPDVATPNVDRLAASGLRFTHAFATAPVCSSSRTAFQTSRYQTSIGGYHHNTRDKKPLPESVPTVTGLMRKAGYFVCNGNGKPAKKVAKSHLNFTYDSKTFFDGVDWSERSEGQPFFAQIQIKEPHRTFVKADRIRRKAPIPSYYPDHPVTRADWSNYLASVEVFDNRVGAILDRLEKEGLIDNTLILLFGDHGRPHVRGKQWLYEGGLHVPLIVSWKGHAEAGQADRRLASLLDAMPTTLAAAGVAVPQTLEGLDLFSKDPSSQKGHDLIFAARDRCGDAVDRIRSVRNREFKYIRNFYPDRPYLQHSGYKKLQYPVETLMKVLHRRGEWDSPFMAKTRPAEELYDLRKDPEELHNLATNSAHQKTLKGLRAAVDNWIKSTGDQGATDESKTVDMDALMKSKRKYYESNMRKRGLDPELSDEEYLSWWKRELGVSEEAKVE